MTSPSATRRRLWRGAVQARRMMTAPSAGLRALPDYLIVGAQRAGTTTLQKHLFLHQDVLPPGLVKGVHYFDTNFSRGPSWYRSHFPTARARSRAEHRSGHPVVTGEASPYYLFHPQGPSRIAGVVPDARIVMLLRDPVARAYSHYLHEQRRGFEDLRLEEALDAEPARLAGEEARLFSNDAYSSFAHQHHSYVARGIYHEQVARYLEHFEHDQILILQAEAFFADPAAGYLEVCRHLGIREWIPEEFDNLNANTYLKPLPDEVRRLLVDGFREPNERLTELLGRSFGWDS